jgi:cysteine desulfurase
MLPKPIYLDYNATTPVDPAVLEAMLPYFKEAYGNAASVSHAYGWEADGAVKKARKQVADLVGSESSEIYFTSGATESNNLALQGLIRPILQQGEERPHLITTAIEHKCVIEVAAQLQKWGCEVTVLKPNSEGLIDPKQLEMALEPNTKLVSIIHAQNEIGSIQNIEDIGNLLKARGIPLHIDAAQSVGKLPINLKELPVDMLSASSQ